MIGGISQTGPVAATSPDGIAWTNRTLPGGGGWVFPGAWSGSLLVCGSQNGVYTSSDAINYTYTALANGQRDAILYSPSLNLFVSSGNTRIHTSTNGITWALRYTGATYAFGDWSPTLSLFVLGGSNTAGTTNRIITSPDGINWTPRTSQDQRISPKWIPSLGAFLGTSYSYDGFTWINSGITLYDALASSNTVIVSASANTMKRSAVAPAPPGGISANTISLVITSLIIGWRDYARGSSPPNIWWNR